ncbi:MAG: ROK family protein [Planctomycetaceae bacterium]|nr:ROK family protein [Planctomycetaceae bacterium]
MNILALDIGGSKIMSAIATASERGGRKACVLDRIAKKTLPPDTNAAGLLEEIRGILPDEKTIRQCGAVGVNIPGLADPKTGMWIYAPFSGIQNIPIAEILSEMVGGKPVAIDNDANACALAEKLFGICTEINDFLWITISNGIGGGLVLDGKVYRGPGGNAGEFGHLVLVENGALCGCGNRGCMEAEAAGPGIVRRFRNEFEKRFGKESEALTAAEIADLARQGDPVAMDVYQTTARLLGQAASYAVNLLNLPMIVLGGGVSEAFDLLAPEMGRTLHRFTFQAANPNVRIGKTALGYEAALVGAAATGLQES